MDANLPGGAWASDREYCPTLTQAGRDMLERLRSHPSAPRYRNRSGNKLLAEEVDALRAYEREVMEAGIGWSADAPPPWLADFLRKTYAAVPYYRACGSPPARLVDVAPISRAELAHDIAAFVPDDADLARMINFQTTGTTGHPLLIASHPLVAGRYLAFHKRALQRFGVTLRHGAGQVGVMLLGHQRRCFTYVSVTPTMGESGLAKINLHVDDWRDPDDRARYLDAMAPELIAGDPISFAELLTLPMAHRPAALLSVSMMLLPGMRARLEAAFGCPVLDIYSLNEVGPVAVYDEQAGGHVLLQHGLYVEILDAAGRPVPEGTRGEITLTGGFNFCLPLVRYRTGDYASLAHGPHGPVLVGLAGRSPLRYKTIHGGWINNIDITHALKPLAIAVFGVHQQGDASVVLRLAPNAMPHEDQARALLAPFFGAIGVEVLLAEDKIIQYTSDLREAVA
ncbi:capsule biosynthesis protein CapK [Janthinobacterium sp. SUN118]|uniref:capsule biosynthesis protein CapK n=1 Tax=Janthinobacterium sp. SUN118 TaxID=3004100 RepID=UPI0025AF3AA2|nr:capsule biosynthesis protein CapK [Janthinobacterium sp. SUN118]MDN2712256.1 capsule biosynthesis protein CapK [Janthinobacterium sp. SUN118]